MLELISSNKSFSDKIKEYSNWYFESFEPIITEKISSIKREYKQEIADSNSKDILKKTPRTSVTIDDSAFRLSFEKINFNSDDTLSADDFLSASIVNRLRIASSENLDSDINRSQKLSSIASDSNDISKKTLQIFSSTDVIDHVSVQEIFDVVFKLRSLIDRWNNPAKIPIIAAIDCISAVLSGVSSSK